MNLKTVLTENNFPEEVINALSQSGISELYPPQAQAIEKGILQKKNLLMSVPTAAGKTLIAELCMLKSIFEHNGRCLYIAPLKALASEKYEDFKKKYAKLGVQIGLATGDYDTPNKFLNRYQILISTAEKVDSLLRFRAKWLIDTLSVLILDEIHFINDGSRGPTMEILVARLKQLNPNLQILALSATINNAQAMANWLKAELVVSQWRPIPLKEGIYYNEQIQFHNGTIRMISEEAPDDLSKLTLDTLRGKGQVLIFVNSRRSAQATSRLLSPVVVRILNPKEKDDLAIIAKSVAGARADTTKLCRKLADAVLHGAAFHHAGLKPNQRKLVEDNFKKNIIKVICATPTLAAGVNLPARRAIIRDYRRYESGLGMSYIPTSEYKQCAGRAGRPQYDDHGEAVLMAKSYSEAEALADRYINASPEPVISKLGHESALRVHVLASIAGGYIHNVNEMFNFFSHTFLAYQKLVPNLIEIITQIFDFLKKEGFIEKQGFHFFATEFGNYTSRLYIDPISSILIRDGLKKINDTKSPSAIGLLHIISSCPDSPSLHLTKNNFEELEGFTNNFDEELIFHQDDYPFLSDIFSFYSSLKTTWLLLRWIEEEKEDIICDQFNIGPGDIYRHIESCEWLLHAATVIADLFQYKKLTFLLENLRQRVRYGIKEELLEIVRLKGIGRVRARVLYNKGFKRMGDLKFASIEDLSKINQIGKVLAKSIIEQASEGGKKRLAHSFEEELLDLV